MSLPKSHKVDMGEHNQVRTPSHTGTTYGLDKSGDNSRSAFQGPARPLFDQTSDWWAESMVNEASTKRLRETGQ